MCKGKRKTEFFVSLYKSDTLLPSNCHKGIDCDLLLVQQKQKIFDQFPRLKSTVKGDTTLWNSSPDGLRCLATKQKLQAKNNFIKNFNWLQAGQQCKDWHAKLPHNYVNEKKPKESFTQEQVQTMVQRTKD